MRIRIEVRRTLDLDAFERGQAIFLYRCWVRLQLRLARGGWSSHHLALIDTGAPYSVLPATL